MMQRAGRRTDAEGGVEGRRITRKERERDIARRVFTKELVGIEEGIGGDVDGWREEGGRWSCGGRENNK